MVPDSAATAFAMVSGVKVNTGKVGVRVKTVKMVSIFSRLVDAEEEEDVGAGNIPENIIRECKKFLSLDRSLDKKAKKNNMTRKQVKLLHSTRLKHYYQYLLAMFYRLHE